MSNRVFSHPYVKPGTGSVIGGRTFYSTQDYPQLPVWPIDTPIPTQWQRNLELEEAAERLMRLVSPEHTECKHWREALIDARLAVKKALENV